jgi:vanillate O-demethylase monooxygenase subunit
MEITALNAAPGDTTRTASGSWRAGERNYPLNMWWAAAPAKDVGEEMLSCWLLDRRVVLYRLADGTPNALEDRCPHRWAPLSEGKREGDTLVCGYHGFRFDPDGTCTETPSQADVKPTFCARRYPVQEHEGFVWIWMGDVDKADPALLPAIPSFTTEGNLTISGHSVIKCNYMLLQENVLDLTHFAYVHPEFGVNVWDTETPEFTVDKRTVKFFGRFENNHLPPQQALPMGITTETPVDREDYGMFYSPACNVGSSDVFVTDASGEQKVFEWRVVHLTTPISMNECHYWWVTTQNYGQTIPGMTEMMQEFVTHIVGQDKVFLEAIQETVDRDSRGPYMPEISVKKDFGGLQARKILIEMMEEEEV